MYIKIDSYSIYVYIIPSWTEYNIQFTISIDNNGNDIGLEITTNYRIKNIIYKNSKLVMSYLRHNTAKHYNSIIRFGKYALVSQKDSFPRASFLRFRSKLANCKHVEVYIETNVSKRWAFIRDNCRIGIEWDDLSIPKREALAQFDMRYEITPQKYLSFFCDVFLVIMGEMNYRKTCFYFHGFIFFFH